MSDTTWFVGERLRAEREQQDLSLAELGALTGVSKTYLLRLETDRETNPSLEVLRRIADALDITVADLLGAPALRFVADDASISPSLRAFADEEQLKPRELETLASIRFRKGQEPKTSKRWRYILDSLRVSQKFDEDDR
jgi:transcriptional regulator with XRE-family HTH domain